MPDGIDSEGDALFDAVFADGYVPRGPHDVAEAGIASPHGTIGQGGNAVEWEESARDGTNDFRSESRGRRAGWWNQGSNLLRNTMRTSDLPIVDGPTYGLRVAAAGRCIRRGTVQPFGRPGCNGSNGTPPIHAVTHGNGTCGPLQGTPTTYALSNTRPNAIGVLHIGFYTDFWNGFQLPLDLSFIGMTNCFLNHDLIVSPSIAADAAGNGALTFSWPVDPVALGLPFYTTIALIDLGANLLHVVHTNTVRVTQGTR